LMIKGRTMGLLLAASCIFRCPVISPPGYGERGIRRRETLPKKRHMEEDRREEDDA